MSSKNRTPFARRAGRRKTSRASRRDQKRRKKLLKREALVAVGVDRGVQSKASTDQLRAAVVWLRGWMRDNGREQYARRAYEEVVSALWSRLQ